MRQNKKSCQTQIETSTLEQSLPEQRLRRQIQTFGKYSNKHIFPELPKIFFARKSNHSTAGRKFVQFGRTVSVLGSKF